jgi:pimeloyl-ACP methyl ester carboxylesterase
VAILLATVTVGCAAGAAGAVGPVPRPVTIDGLAGSPRLAAVDREHGMVCGDYRVPVPRRDSVVTEWTLAVRLCGAGRAAFTPSATVQVLLPGAGYRRTYWDLPGFAGRYSYVRRAVAAGYLTAAVDPLGVGGSSHPDGARIGYGAQAWAVHTLLTDLARGAFGVRLPHRVLVGHSLGGYVAWTVAARYPDDLDALVLLDATHAGRLPTAVPAGDGYLVLAPGSRCRDFYWRSGAVCRADERTNARVTIPAGQLTGIPAGPAHVTVPVYLVVGAHDTLSCGRDGDCADGSDPAAHECARFRAAPSCRLWIAPATGYSGVLGTAGPAVTAHVLRWLDRYQETA